ncbi:MAG: ABC transporter substrate-binding protein [Candidatus Thorarchaeota archaeon]
MRKLWSIALSCILLLIPLMLSPSFSAALRNQPSGLNVGPYVDKIVYLVEPDQDQRVLDLLSGIIEMDLNFTPPQYFYASLDGDPDIDVYSALRNGYGHITINCAKYPLNISGFRRAFAYAFDKVAVQVEIFDGFSRVHDSVVPYANGWSIEDDLDYHYYTNRSDIGNQILDNLNFSIDSGTGYRLAPDGSPFDVVIEYTSSSPEIAGCTAQIGVDALRSLDVNASVQAAEFNEYISRLDSHGDYDMVFYAFNFIDYDVDWLGSEYWSEYADVPYQNPCNFRNATYDSWRDQLLYGTTYDEVYEAASEMQKILQYNVPRLVVYMNIYLQPYRNDKFAGHVPDLGRHISGPWTMRKIHKIDGEPGGTVTVGISTDPDSFNIFLDSNMVSESMFYELWPSLFTLAPDLTPFPYLVRQMITETHADNSSVPDGHTRFTIDIIDNATWSDGVRVTAEDVAFTHTYMFEAGITRPITPIEPMTDFVAAYAPSPTRVIMEYSTESFWHFSEFAYTRIIPKHIFNETIGYDGWMSWDPVYDPEAPHVTSGPYVFEDFEPASFYELGSNPDFAFYPEFDAFTTDYQVSSDYPVPDTPPGNHNPLDLLKIASAAIAGASSVIIIVMVLLIIRYRSLEDTNP